MEQQQNKAETPNEYVLTNAERGAIQAINQQVVLYKAAVYNAEVAAENARAALRDLERELQGALNMLAAAHGMSCGKITPDMTKLIRG